MAKTPWQSHGRQEPPDDTDHWDRVPISSILQAIHKLEESKEDKKLLERLRHLYWSRTGSEAPKASK